MFSRFLPATWDFSAPLGLLAGSGGVGSYPWEIVKNAQKQGVALKLIALKNETSPELEQLFDKESVRRISVGDLGGGFKAFKQLQVKGLIIAGSIDPGHVIKGVFPDLRAMALWASLKEKNAESIIGAVSAEIEKEGVKVLDARSFMDEAVATAGEMVKGAEKVTPEAVAHAIKIAEVVAQNDIGQGVITRKGTVLAVEAFDGTDAMIARAESLKADQKIFVKTVKARQDWRFDVPIFGLKTLKGLAKSHVKTVVLKADGVIIPQRAEVFAQAKKLGISLIGY